MPVYPTLAPFLAAFNADPTDSTLCGAFADFLAENPDNPLAPLAPGFAALGHHRRAPHWFSRSKCWGFFAQYRPGPSPYPHALPGWWASRIQRTRHVLMSTGMDVTGLPFDAYHTPEGKPRGHNGFILLKAAARAFTRLHPARAAAVMGWEPGVWGDLPPPPPDSPADRV